MTGHAATPRRWPERAIALAAIAIAMAAAVAAVVSPAAAQSKKATGAVGLASFAAVQAPEAATEGCYAATPARAEACAMRRCQAKAGKGACFAVTLCAPGRWAGIMGVAAGDISFADVLCGAATEAALVAGLKAYCAGHLPLMKQCSIGEIWDPNGIKKTVDISWSAADFKP